MNPESSDHIDKTQINNISLNNIKHTKKISSHPSRFLNELDSSSSSDVSCSQNDKIEPILLNESVIFTPLWYLNSTIANPNINFSIKISEYESKIQESLPKLEIIERRRRFGEDKRISQKVPADIIKIFDLNETYKLDKHDMKLVKNYKRHEIDLRHPSNWKDKRPWDTSQNSISLQILEAEYSPKTIKKDRVEDL